MDLQAYLEKTGMSQTEFAKAIQMTQSAVSKYVLKRRVPSPKIIYRIVAATSGEVGVEDMLYEYDGKNE